MASEPALFQDEAPRSLQPWRIVRMIVTLTFGGAICGSLIGIFLGAICGILYGLGRGDVSLGLDGSLLGGLILAGAGACYGAYCGVADWTRSSHSRA